jgi:hypothetical protein
MHTNKSRNPSVGRNGLWLAATEPPCVSMRPFHRVKTRMLTHGGSVAEG